MANGRGDAKSSISCETSIDFGDGEEKLFKSMLDPTAQGFAQIGFVVQALSELYGVQCSNQSIHVSPGKRELDWLTTDDVTDHLGSSIICGERVTLEEKIDVEQSNRLRVVSRIFTLVIETHHLWKGLHRGDGR